MAIVSAIDKSKIQGIFHYGESGHSIMQVMNIGDLFYQVLTKYELREYIELGCSCGGLSILVADLAEAMERVPFPIAAYDIEQPPQKALNDKRVEWLIGDLHERYAIRGALARGVSRLILVDGGNKALEFRLAAPHLRSGDIIMVHDYFHDQEAFDKSTVWNWFECSYAMVQESVEIYGLKDITAEEGGQNYAMGIFKA